MIGSGSTNGSAGEPGSTFAAFLVTGESLDLAWANDDYLRMLGEPYSSEGVMGRSLIEVSPIAATRADALREVMRTGADCRGEDRLFKAGGLGPTYEWRAYRPLPEYVLVVIYVHA